MAALWGENEPESLDLRFSWIGQSRNGGFQTQNQPACLDIMDRPLPTQLKAGPAALRGCAARSVIGGLSRLALPRQQVAAWFSDVQDS